MDETEQVNLRDSVWKGQTVLTMDNVDRTGKVISESHYHLGPDGIPTGAESIVHINPGERL